MSLPLKTDTKIWPRFREYLTNPVTWKSLLYLFLKFPLGFATFLILATLLSLTLAFLSMPITYSFLPALQESLTLGLGLQVWRIDSILDALIAALIGLLLWPLTLHVTNALTWIHARFARLMLGLNPSKNSA